ncbi:MAG: prepilin-type N-terminal cleavage/methylation domain-containing protein [Sumerlaeia bacterium]
MILRRSPRPPAGFVLLEVMIALVILAMTLVALLRGFALALGTVRSNNATATASFLAASLMEDYELEPPLRDQDGKFSEDPRFGEAFENYGYEVTIEEEDVRYRDEDREPLRELDPMYKMTLKIRYTPGEDGYDQSDSKVLIAVDSYLVETQLFSKEAMQQNQLF